MAGPPESKRCWPDGTQHARAISFFTVANGKIIRLVEFWPEPYEAPSNRKHLVEAIE